MASSKIYIYFDVANIRLCMGCVWKGLDFKQEWFDHVLQVLKNDSEIFKEKLLEFGTRYREII